MDIRFLSSSRLATRTLGAALTATVLAATAGLFAADPAPVASSQTAIIRIKAGVKKPFVDVDGNTWLPEKAAFTQGVVADRDVLTLVKDTRNPSIYRSERYGMTAFSWPVANGDYVIRLHFAEMYPRVTGPGQRVFTFNVEGHEVKNFDIWAAAGGPQRAHIESVPAHIEDGRLDITFTRQIQSPTVNAIEIVPAALAEK